MGMLENKQENQQETQQETPINDEKQNIENNLQTLYLKDSAHAYFSKENKHKACIQ